MSNRPVMQKYTIDQIQIGQNATIVKTVSAEDVNLFVQITGDNNPLHTDQAYAENTVFKGLIAPGVLTAGLISAAIAVHLPGPGSIYLEQTLRFLSPVYHGDTITATVEVLSKIIEKKRVTLRTVCTNQVGAVVVEGRAVILLPDP